MQIKAFSPQRSRPSHRKNTLSYGFDPMEQAEKEGLEEFWSYEYTPLNTPELCLSLELCGSIPDLDNREARKFLQFLGKVQDEIDSVQTIILRISSYGGSVDTALGIFNLLDSLQIPIITIGNSEVASAGTLLFLLGQERLVYRNTNFLFHTTRFSLMDMNDISSRDFADVNYQRITKIYTKLLLPYFTNDLMFQFKNGKDIYLSAEEVVELGIATGFVESNLFDPKPKEDPQPIEESAVTVVE